MVVNSPGNTIGGTASGAGNVIGDNTVAGVSISGQGATGNVLLGNFIGLDSDIDPLGNPIGVAIESANNTIGGIAIGAANTIGFSTLAGVSISGAGATGNDVLDNFIGTDSVSDNLANTVGVILASGSNTIGEANVIGFNTTAGVSISGAAATANVLIGNEITGSSVGLIVESADNTIGGTANGSGNSIDQNSAADVSISGAAATANVLLGDGIYSSGIGVVIESANNTISAANIQANSDAGISISGASASANLVIGSNISGDGVGVVIESPDNTIGGTAAAAGDVISMNIAAGVSISGAAATGNILLGNNISLVNGGDGGTANGVGVIVDSAPGNTIGGTASGAANTLISNTSAGVSISGAAATANVVLGNTIESTGVGVIIESPGNTIGGSTTSAANVIGLNQVGVSISGASASANLVTGNFIGTDPAGDNLGNGVGVIVNAAGNTIGGNSFSSAPTSGTGNVIGFNVIAGVSISGASASGNVLLGNFIGTDFAGDNLGNAIGVIVESPGNTIGGTTAGLQNFIDFNTSAGVSISASTATSNVLIGGDIDSNAVGVVVESASNTINMVNISGNSAVGVLISGASASADVLLGNTIGESFVGSNFGNGVGVIVESGNTTIGGIGTGDGNSISGNTAAGVSISGASASANLLLGNGFISNNVGLIVESADNTIGGTTSGADNIFNSNASAGISMSGATASGNLLLGNIIGRSAVGLYIESGDNTIGGTISGGNTIYSNQTGVSISVSSATANLLLGNSISSNNNVGLIIESADNTIGGTSSAANDIFSNSVAGVLITGRSASANVLLGNTIGSQVGQQLGNGIGVVLDAAGNTIGGTAAGAGNDIIGNGTAGVLITASSASANVVLGNVIESSAVGVIVESADNTIGGTTAAAANILGIGPTGVLITGSSASANVVLGNFIGTNADGPNQGNGVGVIVDATGNTIGGTTAGAANIIGFDSTAGVSISGAGNVVLGNFIGTNPGNDDLGNPIGVIITSGNNTIGGTTAGSSNTIDFNTAAGVSISGAAATSNVVLGNDINANNVGVVITSGTNTIGGIAAGSSNTIDSNDQAGVWISGASASSNVLAGDIIMNNGVGVMVGSGSNTIGGTTPASANSLSGNATAGVLLSLTSSSSVVMGNSFEHGNVGLIVESGNNTIGGTTPGAANVFGLDQAGVSISGAAGASNELLGNFIGTDSSGDNLGNAVGVVINTANNTIGGIGSGAGNVIAFNTAAGVSISGTGGTGNLVIGNEIGIGAGNANMGNAIGVAVNSEDNTIGGARPAGNVIGFSTTAGVSISGAGGTGNVLLGNFIGTDSAGSNLGNPVGVAVDSAGNTIGGAGPGAGNTIGFNSLAGVEISGAGGTANVLLGNEIGTDGAGANLANAVGVSVGGGSNTIGGAASGSGNVIGDNSAAGVSISGQGATGNVVLGNDIGTNGSASNLGNPIGVSISSANNTIGGTTAGAANEIGFSTAAGISISGAGGTGNVVLGNDIGTDGAGARLANAVGVSLESGGNTIGGANVIGFNTGAGVSISGAGGTGNVVLGNFIGTNPGDAKLGNAVGVVVNSANNTIGGTTGGSANVIGFNSTAGVQIAVGGTTGVVVIGNDIGTDSSGRKALANDIGVDVTDGTSTTIGGTASGSGNVISGNLTAGIELEGSGVSGTLIAGNRIGTDPSGTSSVVQAGVSAPAKSLQNAGIVILGSQGNTIGGTSPQARNVISGNYVGIMLAGTSGQGGPDEVAGNFIGTDASGVNPLGNIVGIYINDASENQIGGTAPGAGNVISANTSVGVEIYGIGSTANVVAGNAIGLAADGKGLFRMGGVFTQSDGVFIQDASGNTIGGTSAVAGNVISGNETAGILIEGLSATSQGNVIEGNRIGLGPKGNTGPGNDGYGVVLDDASHNVIRRAGAARNRFGRNGIADVYSNSGTAKAHRLHGLIRGVAHPKGPAHHPMLHSPRPSEWTRHRGKH